MNEPILVIGATGTIGGYLVEELLKRGVKVRALVRSADKAKQLESRGVDISVGDLSSADSLKKAIRGVRRAFLLTPGKPYHPDQVLWAHNFIQVAKGSDIEYIVYHSIWGAGLDKNKPLAMQGHAQSEAAIKDAGLAYTFLRTNFGMQSLLAQGMGQTVAHEGTIYTPLGDAGVAFIDLRDVAKVAAVCLSQDGHDGKTYELSGPEVLTSADLAGSISKVLNRKINYIVPTLEQTLASFKQMGMPDWFINDFPTLLQHNQSGILAHVSSAVRDVTKDDPLPFERFVRDHLNAFVKA